MSKKPVFRYAPSPTGPQHIGGLRTALYCYLLANNMKGELILRIEDTDQTRYVEGAEEFIINACNWLGIEFTQGVHVGGENGPYRQSERTGIYREYVQKLIDNGSAYFAFDTEEDLTRMREELEAMNAENRTYNFVTRMNMKNSLTMTKEEVEAKINAGEPYVIRFRVPEKSEIRFNDHIRGWVHFHGSAVDDKVLLKSDGFPTYHLANVVDDHLMGVTHVVRGEEWLSSTPLHILLYKAFGWEDEIPEFAHLALLLDPKGRKLSKRNADQFGIPVFPFNWFDQESGETWDGYKDLGYLPEALINYIALLGWNPGTENEIMSKEELIAAFSLERCHKAGARVELGLEKLKSFQQHYLRAKSNDELAEMLAPTLEEAGISHPGSAYLAQVCELMRERITFIKDILNDAPFLFGKPTVYDEKMSQKAWKGESVGLITEYMELIKGNDNWDHESLHHQFGEYVAAKETGFGKVMAPLRLALTGVPAGPGCFEMMELFGKDESVARIAAAIDTLVPV